MSASSSKRGNWVDRGDSPVPVLARVLAHHFGLLAPSDQPALKEHATTILGMVAANASEIQVAGYLKHIARTAQDEAIAPSRRLTAIALWHIAKTGLLRDFAERVSAGKGPSNDAPRESLSAWLAQRLGVGVELPELSDDADS